MISSRHVFASFAAAGILWGCGGAVSVAPSPAAPRTLEAYQFPAGKGGQLISPGFAAVEGNLFKVAGGRDIAITSLGYENERSPQPFVTTAIFDSNGNVLASAQISSNDALADGYYWHEITPLTLRTGQQYYVGSLHGAGTSSMYYWNTETATTPPIITDMGTYFKVSGTIDGGSWQYGGGTSQYGSGEIRHYVGNFKSHVVP